MRTQALSARQSQVLRIAENEGWDVTITATDTFGNVHVTVDHPEFGPSEYHVTPDGELRFS